VRGLDFEDFAGTKESQKETETDCQYTGVSCLVPIVFRGLPLRKLTSSEDAIWAVYAGTILSSPKSRCSRTWTRVIGL